MGINKKYERYYKKVYKEFGAKNPDILNKAVGRYNVNTILTNKKAYETFKQRIQQERRREKERSKIKQEVQHYDIRRKERQIIKADTELKKQGFSKGQRRQIIDLAEKEGTPIHKLGNVSTRSKAISQRMVKDLLFEYDVNVGGSMKKRKGVFSKQREEPELQKYFKELENLVSSDKNALINYQKSMEYFLNEIIPQRYQEWKDRGGEYVTPPLQFRKNMLKNLIGYYKKIM